ncbi:MAG: EamA family transporter [bacterium]|nr:EamA family transporter [bacterium]
MTTARKPFLGTLNPKGIPYLLAVYFFWGSTYLAIRIAVRGGDGMPPFMLGVIRTGIAGTILLTWSYFRYKSIRLTKTEFIVNAISGTLLWVGGNGLVNFAEQRAESGYAALLVGALPLWVTIMEGIIDRKVPTLKLVGALVIGFLGLGVLLFPVIQHGDSGDILSAVALLAAPLCWGAGSILMQRKKSSLPSLTSSAYQHLFGFVAMSIVSLLSGETLHPLPLEIWLAVGYLIVAGSIIAYTSYLTSLTLLPISVVTTYAYVNPVIAVLLGWLLIDEPVSGWTLGGMALIIAGVVGVFHEKRK